MRSINFLVTYLLNRKYHDSVGTVVLCQTLGKFITVSYTIWSVANNILFCNNGIYMFSIAFGISFVKLAS